MCRASRRVARRWPEAQPLTTAASRWMAPASTWARSDGKVHYIVTSTMTDSAQIAVGLKDTNGNATPPNLVAVVP